MIKFELQLNNNANNQIKTIDELVRDSFSVKKPTINLPFFYKDFEKPNKDKQRFPDQNYHWKKK